MSGRSQKAVCKQTLCFASRYWGELKHKTGKKSWRKYRSSVPRVTVSWAKWTRQNTFFTVPGRVTLIRHACPALRELIGLAAAQCRGRRKIDLLHANWMRKKGRLTWLVDTLMFSWRRTVTRSPDISSARHPGRKVIIWTPCRGHSLTEEWSGDKEPIDRLANNPRAPPVNPRVSQASPTSTPPTIHVLIPPTASCYRHWLHNNLHWLSLGGLNHPWMMDEFAEWVDSFFFSRGSCQSSNLWRCLGHTEEGSLTGYPQSG